MFPAFDVIAAPAEDNAGNYTTGTWTNGSNLGTGFTAWTLGTSTGGGGFAGFFVGDSTVGSGNINSSGQSFGMYANPGGASADAYRGFSSALAVGETFSVRIAVSFRNGNKGFDLFSSGAMVFNLNVGGDQYTVNNAASGNGNLFGGAYSAQTVLTLSFTQTSLAGGDWQIMRSGGLADAATGTYTGAPTDFHFYVAGTDSGDPANNLYFNNLLIAVPEPSTWALCVVASGAAATFLRRHRRVG